MGEGDPSLKGNGGGGGGGGGGGVKSRSIFFWVVGNNVYASLWFALSIVCVVLNTLDIPNHIQKYDFCQKRVKNEGGNQ